MEGNVAAAMMCQALCWMHDQLKTEDVIFTLQEFTVLLVFSYIHIQYVWMLVWISMQFHGLVYKEIM